MFNYAYIIDNYKIIYRLVREIKSKINIIKINRIKSCNDTK